MHIVSLLSAATWVDLIFLLVSKFAVKMTTSLDTWYLQFGVVGATTDILVLVLGVLLARMLFNVSGAWLVAAAVLVQLFHDILFGYILAALPSGQNSIVDLFKQYSEEGRWKILVADAAMIASTVVFAYALDSFAPRYVLFSWLLAVYAVIYSVYTIPSMHRI